MTPAVCGACVPIDTNRFIFTAQRRCQVPKSVLHPKLQASSMQAHQGEAAEQKSFGKVACIGTRSAASESSSNAPFAVRLRLVCMR